jgi:hypothetical protein
MTPTKCLRYSHLSVPLRHLRDAKLPDDPISPALQQLMDSDDGALCCVTVFPPLAVWCDVLLAMPDGSNADRLLRSTPGLAPIKSLLVESEPLCGLCIHQVLVG